MRTTSAALGTVVLAASVVLTGCSGSSGDEFCGPLLKDTTTSATVFTVAIPGMTQPAEIERRLELLKTVTPPAELADDLKTWTGYLESVAGTIEKDPQAALGAYDDPAIAAASDALSSQYTQTCLK